MEDNKRILFINPPSEFFNHVPMGTIGLCNYLNSLNIKAKILNLSLYELDDIKLHLDYYIHKFNPTHIGLILHWQEAIKGFIWTGEYLKSNYKDITLICGGFTAGYFGKNLLDRFYFIDFLIKGDPEKPVELLLKNEDNSSIPNLIFRHGNNIIENKVTYLIDELTLSNISFCDLDNLYDYDRYISILNKGLGFPLFIGRGCTNNCRYCGGSIVAFRLHSERKKPVFRTIKSIIIDLKLLKNYTNKIYICCDINRNLIKELFKAIRDDNSLRNKFILNYGAWNLLDKEFLELYKEAFHISKSEKPVIEISPEVFDDDMRKHIKSSDNYFSIDALVENIDLINSHFERNLFVSLYFSRYHETHDSYIKLKREIAEIYKLKNDFLMNNIKNIVIRYDHLSTDVGSYYWENFVDDPHDVNSLITSYKLINTHQYYSYPYNNICIYKPKNLTNEDILKIEMMIFILRLLEDNFIELFHISLRRLGRELFDIIDDIIEKEYKEKSANIFFDISYYDLLTYISEGIKKKSFFYEKIPFIEDLVKFCITKDKLKNRKEPLRISYIVDKPRLNYPLISIHENDYLNFVVLLKRMEIEKTFAAQLTVYIFLIDEILTMPFETYKETIKRFEEGISLKEYYNLMEKNKIFNLSYHQELIKKLFESYVLY